MSAIPDRESLSVEFKSDLKRLPDADLVAAVVCLTNTEGGVLYLGVEGDGSVSGLHQTHRDMPGLAALIANRTNPPVSVRVSIVVQDGVEVARIEVPKSPRLVATSDGLLQRRMVKADGTPECVPFYPHEFIGRQSALGLYDLTAQPVPGSSLADLDPLERERLRRMIETYHGDSALLGLTDEHFVWWVVALERTMSLFDRGLSDRRAKTPRTLTPCLSNDDSVLFRVSVRSPRGW